jgi:hypothetical protein
VNDNNRIGSELKAIGRILDSEAVELIDFDRLNDLLSELCTKIQTADDSAQELKYLKAEYRMRIVGMLKANLTCGKNEDDAEMAVRLSDDSIDIKASELVKMYGRVAARFRKNFPASFNYLPGRYGKDAGHRNWREYKI